MIKCSWTTNIGTNKQSIHCEASFCISIAGAALLRHGLFKRRRTFLPLEARNSFQRKEDKVLCSRDPVGSWMLTFKRSNLQGLKARKCTSRLWRTHQADRLRTEQTSKSAKLANLHFLRHAWVPSSGNCERGWPQPNCRLVVFCKWFNSTDDWLRAWLFTRCSVGSILSK